MENLGFRRVLLAGTALVGVSAFMFGSPALAAGEFAVDTDNSNDGVYETDINTGTAWTANDGHDLRVDETGTLTLTTGDTFGDGTVTQAAIAPAVTGKTLTLSDQSDNNAAVAIDFNGNVDVGELAAMSLVINGDGVDAAGDGGGDTLAVDINGNVDLGTGTLTIAADQDSAGSDVSVTVSGDVTTSAITLNAAAAGSDVTITFDGVLGQTVTGTIDGGTNAEGNIIVTNTNLLGGVTFAGDIGATKTIDSITVNNDGSNVTATFQGDVNTANGISFGDNSGTDTNTLVFDTSGGALAVNGAVAGGGAADTNVISVIGGDTVTSDSAWITNIDTVALSGSGTKLTTGGALTATTVTIGAGTTLDAAGGTVTAAVNITGAGGAVTLGDDIDVTGAVDNTSGAAAGTLTITDAAGGGASVISGNVGGTTALSAINFTGDGTAQFDGTVAASTITASSTGTLDFNDSVTGAINLSGDAVVDLATTKTITGAVNNTSGAGGSGTLTLATTGGTTTVTGAVGSSNSLAQVNINGTGTAAFGSTVNADDIAFAAAGAATFAGTVTTANGIDLANNNATVTFANGAGLTGDIVSTGGANGTLNFSGNSTVTGQIGTGAGNRIAAVNINGAGSTVSISGDSFMGALTTLANAAVSLGGDTTVNGAVTNGGSVRIAAGTTLTAASFGGAGTYNIAITDDGDGILNAVDFGSLASAGAIDLAAETVNFVFTGNVAEGAAVVLASGGAPAVDALAVTDSSIVLDAALVANGNDHELTVTRNAITSIVSGANNQAVGAVLDSIAGTTDPELSQIMDSVASASTAAELEDVLEAAAPSVDGGAVAAGIGAVNTTTGITNTRLAALRDDGQPMSGMVAGNLARGLQGWGQLFGSSATQDARDDVDGYELDTIGIAGGIDSEMIREDWVFGAAFSYANSEVASDNANRAETDVDTYQLSAYANYDMSDRTYISGQVGYAWADNETTRTNVGGVTGLTATGEYESSAYTLRAEAGRAIKNRGNMTITPKAIANYLYYDSDGYTETGAGGAGLTTASDSMQILEFGAGVDIAWLYQRPGGAFVKPRVHGGLRYDLIGDEVETTSSFTGGGTAFRTTGFEPAQLTYDMGAGFTYYSTDNWELTADYGYEGKEDFSSHAGILRAGYRW